MVSITKDALIQQGKRNEYLVLDFVEKHKYSTVAILQQLLDVTYIGMHKIIQRMVNKKLLQDHIHYYNFTRIKIVGLTLAGLYQLADYRIEKLSEDATEDQKNKAYYVNESRIFYPSQFVGSRMMHKVAIQQIHLMIKKRLIDEVNQFQPKSIIVPKPQVKKTASGVKKVKLPDLIIGTVKQGNIAIEVETSMKSKKRYDAIMKLYKLKIDQREYGHIIYFIPEPMTALQRNVLDAAHDNGLRKHLTVIAVSF
ncbi:hypothetical protein [Cysteiniphilum marinum]|uniref:hypothetical protein n=1 Tax=Cysteiniphilum marinum TaxID=2774191 RepID=UPI00193C5589|nr:hypothetical protein [Cysteiniphilum marinum]